MASNIERSPPPDSPKVKRSKLEIFDFAQRPDDGGKIGERIPLLANFMELKLKVGTIRHYHMTIKEKGIVDSENVEPGQNGQKKRRTRIRRDEEYARNWCIYSNMVKSNQDVFNCPTAYDRQTIVLAFKKLGGDSGDQTQFRIECPNVEWKYTGIKYVGDFEVTLDLVAEIHKETAAQYFSVASKVSHKKKKQAAGEEMTEIVKPKPSITMLQALEIILKQKFMLHTDFTFIGRSLFLQDPVADLGNGRLLLKGFYASTRPIAGNKPDGGFNLSVNFDTTNAAVYQETTLFEFLANSMSNSFGNGQQMQLNSEQDVQNMFMQLNDRQRRQLERELKCIRLLTTHTNRVIAPKGFALSASALKFTRMVSGNGSKGEQISVQQYFAETYKMQLRFPQMPMIWAGSKLKKTYFPVEILKVMPFQRVPNAFLSNQLSDMIKQTARPADQRLDELRQFIQMADLSKSKVVEEFGLTLQSDLMSVNGRVLQPPTMKFLNGEVQPYMGAWNIIGQQFKVAAKLLPKQWYLVGMTREAQQDQSLAQAFYRAMEYHGGTYGMQIGEPNYQYLPNVCDLEAFVLQAKKKGNVQFFVVIVPGRPKQYSGYAEIKRCGDLMAGIPSQVVCWKVASEATAQNGKGQQTMGNILLKINAKLDGVTCEISPTAYKCGENLMSKTMFIGADVTHPTPGSLYPSVAAIVGNIDNQPLHYCAQVSVQGQGQEMILETKAMMKKLLQKYFHANQKQPPERIICYRDGVSEGQFRHVMEKEVAEIKLACHELDENYRPNITYIVVVKRHHTRLFKRDINPGDKPPAKNLSAGTVLDTRIVHPNQFDFYLCSHTGIQGTSRPSHYFILLDENNFSSDDIQMLSFQMCHLYGRCTRSVSYPAPCYYAHLVAYRSRLHLEKAISEIETCSKSSGSSGDSAFSEEDVKALNKVAKLPKEIEKKMYWM